MTPRRLPRWALVAALAVVVLVVAVVVIAAGGSSKDDERPKASALPPARSARTIAELQPQRVLERVEALRGIKLRKPPKFIVLTPAKARAQVEKAEARESGGTESTTEARTNLQLVTLLGLVPKGIDLDELAGRVTSQGTLGYYDGDRNEMTIISKGPNFPVGVETTVAHELTHALDEQEFGVFEKATKDRGDADAELAYRSVVEGNASDVEERYRKRYRIPQPDPKDDPEAEKLVRDLPFGIQLQLGFPYAIGQTFVEALRAAPQGERLLALALGKRPPKTSVEILDPTRWVERIPVEQTPLRARAVLGPSWTELDDDPIGAADVLGLLSPTESRAGTAAPVAQAWRGGEYRFLRRGGAAERGCGVPCVSRDAVVGTAAFASEDDARNFASQFGDVLVQNRKARRTGTGVWTLDGGGVAVGRVGTQTTFAYAPTTTLAQKLVREAPQG